MASRVARLRFDLTLTVDDVEFPCADFSATFAVNKVPTASCTLAVGREVHHGTPSPVHTSQVLRRFAKAKVTFRPYGRWSPDDAEGTEKWTEAGEQVIFEGYVQSTGYRKVRGALQYGVQLVHWLADLAFASALSEGSYPGNLPRWRWRAPYVADATTQQLSGFLGETQWMNEALTEELQEDLWAKYHHKIFCVLGRQDIMGPSDEDRCGGPNDPADNKLALAALARIETHAAEAGQGETIGPDADSGASSPYHVPLALYLEDDAALPLVVESIAATTAAQQYESFWGTTVWDKIVSQLGPQYGYVVIPKIRTAQVVPFMPGLRKPWQKELDIRDIISLDTTTLLPRPLRGVAVLAGGVASRAGEYYGDNVPMDHVGACFVPEGQTEGMVLFEHAPWWLANVPAYIGDPATSIWEVGSATTPKDPGTGAGAAAGPGEVHNLTRTYYERLAQARYMTEVLRGRFGVAQGKLRFDIAPGSIVFLRNKDPLFLPADELSQNLVACVTRVGITLNAEAGQAGTSFQLEYVRTEAENEDDKTSCDGHPLYGTAFSGAPLLHEYLFPDEET